MLAHWVQLQAMISSDLPGLNWSKLRKVTVTRAADTRDRMRKLKLIAVLPIFVLIGIFKSLRSLPMRLMQPGNVIFDCHRPLLILSPLLLFDLTQHAILVVLGDARR